jgi:hypothetical protein
MNGQTPDPELIALFERPQDISGSEFSCSVLKEVTNRRYRRIALRLLPGFVFAPFVPDAQTFAIKLAELLMTSLVNIEGDMITQLLAPINTVAGALSISLIVLRVAYLRVFLRG